MVELTTQEYQSIVKDLHKQCWNSQIRVICKSNGLELNKLDDDKYVAANRDKVLTAYYNVRRVEEARRRFHRWGYGDMLKIALSYIAKNMDRKRSGIAIKYINERVKDLSKKGLVCEWHLDDSILKAAGTLDEADKQRIIGALTCLEHKMHDIYANIGYIDFHEKNLRIGNRMRYFLS